MSRKLNTPVLFLVFNRLDTTKQVFSAISEAKPPRIYIASDGAREGVVGEKEKVEAVRKYILENINWDCEVKTLFRDKNLGCGRAVSGAITWFFENEEQGIILEDDCLPSQSFFYFCEDLLTRYKNDNRIGQISGFNFGFRSNNFKYGYFFSIYPSIWGWATWKNRWSNYSFNFEDLDEVIENKQLLLFFKKNNLNNRVKIFKDVSSGLIDTWDYQWSFSLYKNNQLSVIPSINYIKNIGFGPSATHTTGDNPYKDIEFFNKNNFNHPKYIVQLPLFNNYIFKSKSYLSRILKIFFKYDKN